MVTWDIKAQVDLAEVIIFAARQSLERARGVEEVIRTKVTSLDRHPMIGVAVPGLDDSYRITYADKQRYRIYYRVLGSQIIQIVRVRSSKQRPLRPDEIEP